MAALLAGCGDRLSWPPAREDVKTWCVVAPAYLVAVHLSCTRWERGRGSQHDDDVQRAILECCGSRSVVEEQR